MKTNRSRDVARTPATSVLAFVVLFTLAACGGSAADTSMLPAGTLASDISNPLAGTRWTLTELDATPVASLPVDSVVPTVEFDTEVPYNIRAFAGCNEITGDVVVAGLSLSIQNLNSSRMFCEAAMPLETQYTQMLQDVRAHAVRSQALVLFDEKGMVRARFRAGL